MKKIYMLSQGEYSDYTVGGLYESDVELTEDVVMGFVPEMIMDQFPDIDRETAETLTAHTKWAISNKIAKHYLGEQPHPITDQTDWDGWCRRKFELLGDKDLNLSTYLEKRGIIKRIPYEEIHLDELWL